MHINDMTDKFKISLLVRADEIVLENLRQNILSLPKDQFPLTPPPTSLEVKRVKGKVTNRQV